MAEGINTKQRGFNFKVLEKSTKGGTSFKDLGYEDFDASETYAAGDVVIYNNDLKKFTTSHEGAWYDADAEPTSVAEEVAPASTALQPADIVDDLESLASDKPISARAVNEDMVNYVDQSITATMLYIDQQDNSEHAGRVAGDNLILKQLGDLPTWTERSEEQGGGSDRAYAEGKYLFHNWTDPTTQETTKRVYRVVSAIEVGDMWSEQNVVMTSVFNELDTLLVGEEEVVHLNITSADALMEVDNLAVTISYEDGGLPQILHCDEVGDVTFSVAKGRFYTITYVDVEGYNKPASDRLKASSAARYINKVYENVVPVLTTTVTINVAVTGSSASVLAGKTVTLALGDNQYTTAAISNNQAVFTGLQRNKTIKVILPRVATLNTPNAITLVTDQAAVSATATYTVIPAGLAVVRDDGYEAAFEDFDFDAHNAVAIHVSTAVLLAAGCDYYVKIADLADNSSDKGGISTSSYKGNFPSVEAYSENNLNGYANTLAITNDVPTSPAGILAMSKILDVGGNELNGCIPTRIQLQVLLDNLSAIEAIVKNVVGIMSWNTYRTWVSSKEKVSSSKFFTWSPGSWYVNNLTYDDNNILVIFQNVQQ